MAKSIYSNSKKKNGLRIAVERLQKSLLPAKKSSSDDVKKGHFAVVAVDGDGGLKRFMVPLYFLTHTSFLRLLDEAAEEYGFYHGGVLTVRCRPAELERILLSEETGADVADGGGGGADKWSSSNKTSLKSC